MASRAEFDSLVQRLLDQANAEDNEKLRRVTELVRDAQGEVLRRLNDAGDFEGKFLPNLRSEIERLLEVLARRVGDEVGLSGEDVVRSATRQVAEPMGLMRIEAVFPAIPAATIEVYENFTVDLIKGVMDEAKAKITREIGLAAVGAKKRAETIEAIGTNLDDPGVFSSIRARAETIYETELKRFRSQVKNTRNRQLNDRIGGGLEKWWLTSRDRRVRYSHRIAGESYAKARSIPIDQAFMVGGFQAQYPRDWSLPARESVRCRCEAVQKLPDRLFDEA